MIYAIEAVGTGFVKIGWTEGEVKERLGSLQTASPFELKAIAWCSGGRRMERELHRKLSAARVRGEWFRRCHITEEVIWEIREHDGYREALQNAKETGESPSTNPKRADTPHRLSACLALSRPAGDTATLSIR